MEELLKLEEKIEHYFISLAELEKQGEVEQYQVYFELLKEAIEKEKNFFKQFSDEEIIVLRNKILKDCQGKESSLALGHMTNAVSWRLLHMFNLISGSNAFSYDASLRYDINQVVLAFFRRVNSE